MNGLAHLGHTSQQPHKNTKNRFIHFSQNTEGRCGRPVFIDAQLLPDFLSAVDITSHSGLEVIKQIEQLRALGGGIASHQNRDLANKHKNVFGDVAVHYYISQAAKEGPNGVYITHISNVNLGFSKPGLFTYNDTKPLTNLAEYFVLEQACIGSSSTLQKMVDKAKDHVSKDAWGKIQFDLFYTPSNDLDEHGAWLTASQKNFNETQASKELSKLLTNTQKSLINTEGSITKIRVFDRSSSVLEKSLSYIDGHLDKLGFEFIDPDSAASSAIATLHKKNAKLSKTPIKTTNRGSLISLSKVRHQLASSLRHADRGLCANDVLGKTMPTKAALSIGDSLNHKSSYFISAVRQANLLGKWQR